MRLVTIIGVILFSVCGCKSSNQNLLPNSSPCIHANQCQSNICCGTPGNGATCSAGCTKPQTGGLDFCNAGERPMLVTNASTKDVWLGLTSGSISCKSQTDCLDFGGTCTPTTLTPGPHGQTVSGVCTCSTTNAGTTGCGNLASCAIQTNVTGALTPPPSGTTLHFCFWNPPRIVGQSQAIPSAHMPNQGDTLKICFPSPKTTGGNFQWSGNMFARHGCDANGQNCASADCAVNVLASSNQALPYCPNALCPSGCTGDECPKNCTLDNPCGPSHKVAPGSTYEKECPNDGTCAPQTGLCNLGEGGQPPATLAEFTLTGTDFYDVSVINGINMGISMAPDLSFAATDQSNPYTCGTPGAKTQASGQSYLKPCPWTVNLTIDKLGDQTNLLRQVLPVLVNPLDTEYPACPCTTPGQVCGLAINVKNTTQAKFVQTCGTDLKAYWTADQICGTIAPGGTTLTNLYPLPCTTDGSTNQNAMQTHMINLLGCIGADGFSCYQTGAQCGASAQSITNLPGTSIGCGCPTAQGNPYLGTVWPQPGPAVTNNCTNSNPDWVEYIQPWIAPLKTTCPTAYTFPYDDVTSTFTCQASAATKTAGSAPGYYVNFFDTTYVMP